MLDLLKGFLPWIVYFILAGHSPEKLATATIGACVVFVIFEIKYLFKGFILSWGTFLFFLFMLIFVVILRNNWVAQHAWIISNASLAALAWFSLLIGNPFTSQYAREQVDKQYWNSLVFIRINQYLTAIWGAIFLFCALLHVLKLYFPMPQNWVYEISSDFATIVGAWITSWFPEWYKKRGLK